MSSSEFFYNHVEWATPYPSRKRKRIKKTRKTTGRMLFSATDVHVRILESGSVWNICLDHQSNINECKVRECVIDNMPFFRPRMYDSDDVSLVSGYELGTEQWKGDDVPPRRQLDHAREGDIGLWVSHSIGEPTYFFVFRNKTVFARLCWRILAKHVRVVRSVAFYIQKLAVEKSCAPGGRSRAEDLQSFISECT